MLAHLKTEDAYKAGESFGLKKFCLEKVMVVSSLVMVRGVVGISRYISII